MKRPKGTLRMQWLLSYLAILAIPTLLLIYLFLFSLNVLHSQSVYMNQTVLSQFQQIVDGYLTKVNAFASSLSYDDDLEYLGNVSSSKQLQLSYDAISRYQSLRTKSSLAFGGLSGEGAFYIYLNGTDMVYYDSSIVEGKHFYQYYYPQKDTVSYEQWVAEMNQIHTGDFTGGVDGEGNETLTKTLTVSTKGNSAAVTLVVWVNIQNPLDQIVGDMDEKSNTVMILNEDGDVILSSSKEYAKPPKSDNEMEIMENGDVVLQKFSFSGVRYVDIIPGDIFYAPYKNTRYLLLAGVLFSACLSIVFAVFFSKRNYRPITRLIKSAEPFAKTEGNRPREGEYRFIGEALERASQQSREISQELMETKGYLRDLYLRNVLEEREKADDPKRAEYWRTLCYPYFQVFLVFPSFLDSQMASTWERFSSSWVERFFQKALCGSGREIGVAAVAIRQNIVIVVNVSQRSLPFYEDVLPKLLEEFLAQLQDGKGIGPRITVGDLMEGRETLAVGYRQTMISSDYQSDFPGQKILRYSDVRAKARQGRNPLYDPRDEQRFIMLVGNGDYEGAQEMLDEILKQSFGERQKETPLAPQQILNRPGVVGVMCTCAKLYQTCAGKGTLNFTVSLDHFLSCGTYAELYGELCETLKRLCDCFRPDEGGNKELVEKIDKIINESLSDVNLNVSFIANRLKMNANYISYVYKEVRGSSILNQIMRKKIQAAKIMLETTDKSVQSISEELGFSNSNSFIRNFKKWEGVTPGQYKKLAKG